MKFRKCKVLHNGSKNGQLQYLMKCQQLFAINKERNLGVFITSYLKPGQHSSQLVKTANKLIGFIRYVFKYKSEKSNIETLIVLSDTLLNVVYSSGPFITEKNTKNMERVQLKVTRIIPRLKNRPYEERPTQFNLFNLSKRGM